MEIHSQSKGIMWSAVPMDARTKELPNLRFREHCKSVGGKIVRVRRSGSLL